MTDRPDAVEQRKVILESSDKQETKAEKEQRQALGEYSGKQAGQKDMHIKVYSPYRDYYDGMAFSLTAVNDTGTFDILPQHHNFISLLAPCEMVIRTVKTGDQKIRISGGIMHVKADRVIVFLDV